MGLDWGARRAGAEAPRAGIVRVLLDTHFVLWIVTGAARLQSYSWIDRYRPWGWQTTSRRKAEPPAPEVYRRSRLRAITSRCISLVPS